MQKVIVKQYAGPKSAGLDEVSAKIALNKYKKEHSVVTIEGAGWKLSNGKPAYKIVCWR